MRAASHCLMWARESSSVSLHSAEAFGKSYHEGRKMIQSDMLLEYNSGEDAAAKST